MPDLTPEIAEQVVAACGENGDEAAGALSRALDGEFTFAVGEAGTFDAAALPEGLDDGPGLALVLTFGEVGAVVLLPESSGLLPDWYATPDPTGESKLSTLAQELSMLLVPDDLMADAFTAARVDNLQEALARGGAADAASVVSLALTSGEASGTLQFIWPLATPGHVLPTAVEEEAEETADAPPPTPADAPTPIRGPVGGNFDCLPAYARSLLKIQVPVVVQLAWKQLPIREIVEFGPGAIIKFEKSCDETLEMYIGDRQIAEGEVVKVGEKFGLRVTSITLPDERFKQVRRLA